MTTLKDYKEKVLQDYKERFDYLYGDDEDNSKSFRDHNDALLIRDNTISFFSLAIDNAVAEAFKVVEMEKVNVFDDEDYGYNRAINDIEDRKKQYLV